ncbi:PAS domain S-box-containing protein [Azospirillum agricola]|uniref:ATP-binding response regulator n=1 Tax=Azospirillum agricola TaxID=1720247 RepID=UPI001AE230B2|nr:ATP-binding protein [Azospirillum agricola]MBP2228233.1 PAS domain S-box-containing protein [Azospirillum agricola]
MPLNGSHTTKREDWLDALLSANGAPHALLDAQGRLLVANRAFAAALGQQPEEIEGKTLAQAGVPAALAQLVEGQRRRVAVTGASATVAGVLPTGALTLTAVRDADGAVTGVAAIGDADAARLAVAQEEAARARADAERARTAKGKFLSAASHDLRQPFQAMHLFHHLLMMRLTDPASVELGNKLEQSIIGGETLLRALLDVSALEAGLVVPQPRGFPVDETLGQMLEEFGPEAEAKGLRFNVRPAGVEITSDPTLLERLLRPILSNAIRYTESGGVLLAARRRKDRLLIEVWDTGIGIDPANHAAIFEDFHQLGNPGRDRKQGLGLGLAIVRRLAETLGHPVTLRSRPGRGSVFVVEVPLADAGTDEDDPGAEDAAEGDPAETGTVLVIEDDAMQLEGIGLLLRGWGYDVIPVRGIDEAVAGLDAAAPPDLVLSDLRLSGPESGIDAIQAVRARCGRRVPGVIVTGDTDPDRLRSVDRSGLRLLHKPCDPALLKSLLARTLTAGRRPVM